MEENEPYGGWERHHPRQFADGREHRREGGKRKENPYEDGEVGYSAAWDKGWRFEDGQVAHRKDQERKERR